MKRYVLVLLLVSSSCIQPKNASENKRFWGLEYLLSFFTQTVAAPADMARELIKDVYPVTIPHSPVCVQTTPDLSDEERNFVHNRTNKIKHVLSEQFGIEQPLRIGICCSGGGNRAMIGSLGLLLGAAKSKILDATMYLSGLSGSTWSIVPFSYLAATTYKYEKYETILESMKQSYFYRLNDFSMININGIYTPPLISFDSTDDVLVEVAKRFAYNQPVTLVNLFGALVGDYALDLMGCDRLTTFWSTISAEAQLGDIPLPLCSAIYNAQQNRDHYKYEWFEMSPLQAGSAALGYIPVEYLGSNFTQGVLDNDNICPEYPLDFYLGMYGSGFAATIHDISLIQKNLGHPVTIMKDVQLKELPKRHFLLQNSIVKEFAKSIINDVFNCRNPLTYAQFPNYSYGLPNSILRDQETLGVFDAAIDFNVSLPTLIDRPERSMDIVILYDSNPGNVTTLHDLATYCYKKGLSFPDISKVTDSLHKDTMTVLNDPRSWDYDANMTTYIYFPTNGFDVKTPPYITFNFKYEEHEITALSNTMEQAFLSQVDEIQKIMKLVADKKAQ